MRYSRVEPPDAAALESARELLTRPEVDRTVLDIRQNPGGDNHNNPSMIGLLIDFVAAHADATVVVRLTIEPTSWCR